MTDSTPTPTSDPVDNHCYRHPDRETYVRCQRCGRPICGQCQTLAPVGVHCPECVREARATSGSRPIGVRVSRAMSPNSGRPVITISIIVVCAIVFVLECLTGLSPVSGSGNSVVENALAYYPHAILRAPWSIVTVNFVHASILHIGSNMLSLFFVGVPLERYLGRARFAAVFLISGLGAVVSVDFFARGEVVGASGAIFGILGALLIFNRRIGISLQQLIFLIVLNLAISFVDPGISWQAHVGGLVVGAALGLLLLRTSSIRRRTAQIVGFVGVTVLLLAALLLNALA